MCLNLDIHDKLEIMPSLQRPKKLVFIGSDGKRYPFLCKPHDDLRKDARLMDFNSMINKLLQSASESRRRQLCKCFENTADEGQTFELMR
jgi:serine/threonine-protein kinase ATR